VEVGIENSKYYSSQFKSLSCVFLNVVFQLIIIALYHNSLRAKVGIVAINCSKNLFSEMVEVLSLFQVIISDSVFIIPE
jgi:hypothetical protein